MLLRLTLVSSPPAAAKTQYLFRLKEMRNSFKKWPLNLWWISNKAIMEVGNITKVTIFKCFLPLSYRNTQLLFFVTMLFHIFMRKTLINDFWGLHKNMNCAFPLSFDSTLQLIGSISSDRQKLLRSFNGIAIVVSLKFLFTPSAAVSCNNLVW